jgi:hypothetical protein
MVTVTGNYTYPEQTPITLAPALFKLLCLVWSTTKVVAGNLTPPCLLTEVLQSKLHSHFEGETPVVRL